MVRLKGVSSVFLCIVLASYVCAALVVVEAASGYAAGSICENVCAISGRSVLSEFQRNLFDRYGIFAIKKTKKGIEDKYMFYLNGSFAAKRCLIKLKCLDCKADYSEYSFSDGELEKQVKKVIPDINKYILSFFSYHLSERDNTVYRNEAEYIICGSGTDEENLKGIENRIFASRFALNLASIYADDALLNEIRAAALLLLPGAPAELAVFTVAGIKASELAKKDTEDLMGGKEIPLLKIEGVDSYGNYRDYLTAFLLLENKNKKLSAMRELMELNIREKDKKDFCFSDYAYGFRVNARIEKKASAGLFGIVRRYTDVSKEFEYR